MTEFEAIEALSSIAANAATYFTVFFSLTFAYLTVAYIVGADLTRFQCLVISGIYLLSASIFGVSGVTWTNTWVTLKAQESSALDDVWIANTLSSVGGPWVVLIAASAVLVSLYFMYDVRQNAKH
jgi:hypothetical protein